VGERGVPRDYVNDSKKGVSSLVCDDSVHTEMRDCCFAMNDEYTMRRWDGVAVKVIKGFARDRPKQYAGFTPETLTSLYIF
jgi:hypothetical protein